MGNGLPASLRMFIDYLPDPVVCYDSACHIVGINDKGRKNIIKTYNDIRHLRACEIFSVDPSSERQCSECHYKKTREGEQEQTLEEELVLPDGQRGFFRRHLVSWSVNGDRFLMEMWRDLSWEHNLTQELRKRERFLDGFCNLFDIPIFITDEHFRLVGMNRFFEKFAKIPFSHLLGRSLWDVIHREERNDREEWRRGGQRCFLRTRLVRYPEEECNVRWCPVEQHGQLFGHVGFVLRKWQPGFPAGYPHYEMEYFFEICRESSHKETLNECFEFIEELVAKHFRVPADMVIVLFDEEHKSFLWIHDRDERWYLQKQIRPLLRGAESFS